MKSNIDRIRDILDDIETEMEGDASIIEEANERIEALEEEIKELKDNQE